MVQRYRQVGQGFDALAAARVYARRLLLEREAREWRVRTVMLSALVFAAGMLLILGVS